MATLSWPVRRMRLVNPRRVVVHVVLVFAVLVTLGPLVWMLGSSFKPAGALFVDPTNPIPSAPTLANYQFVLERVDLLRQLVNSIVFAGGVTIAQILVAAPAAYAFARWRFPGANLLFALMLLSIPIPFVVYYVPNYVLMARFDLLNTFWGMILPQAASAYGIFLLRQHFRAFPEPIVEAARLDGAGEWRILWQLVLPNTVGAIVALGIFVFITTWYEYIWPLLIAPDKSMYTLTVGVGSFSGGEGGSLWGATMAAAALASTFTLAAYLVSRRRIMSALAEGAVK